MCFHSIQLAHQCTLHMIASDLIIQFEVHPHLSGSYTTNSPIFLVLSQVVPNYLLGTHIIICPILSPLWIILLHGTNQFTGYVTFDTTDPKGQHHVGPPWDPVFVL